ncbi:MAG: HlyC/CorC family transporter [Nitrospirae bacterium]|nr:HlyC/CorC family transporter [Nitrospirota bacterium]
MWIEIFLIFVFILFNGFFAGTEIAVVTSRKSHIQELANKGKKSAIILQRLQSDTDRFLASVQIGVTIAGAIASATGGAVAIKIIKPFLKALPVDYISSSAEPISIGIVVFVVSYLALVIGELVPKSIALKNPERFALITAKPMYRFTRLISPFANILTFSTNLILKPFGGKTFTQRSFISEEEIKLLVREGTDKGIFEPAEEELIHGVFEFTDLSVKEVMVPLTKVVAFSTDMSLEEILSIISEEQYSRYPVYHGEPSNIKGILYVKDLFKKLAAKEQIDIRKILRTPFFVPESLKISTLMRQMQRKGVLIAVVVDEYGSVTGIVTMEDLLEEIVGEIRDEYDVEQPVIKRKDGSFIVDASITIRDLRDDHGIELPESPDYDTVGGYIITKLQRIPETGETFSSDGWKIKIIEMIGKRISRVIITPSTNPEGGISENKDKVE